MRNTGTILIFFWQWLWESNQWLGKTNRWGGRTKHYKNAWIYILVTWYNRLNLTRGPWWPWIAHLSHFPHNWILHLCSFGSNLWPSGWDQFWLQRNQLNKIDKGPQRDAKYQISQLLSFQFQRRRILKLVFFVPTCDPRGGASFDPSSII